MVARYFFELLILYLFLNIIHVEKINTEFYLPVRGLIFMQIGYLLIFNNGILVCKGSKIET